MRHHSMLSFLFVIGLLTLVMGCSGDPPSGPGEAPVAAEGQEEGTPADPAATTSGQSVEEIKEQAKKTYDKVSAETKETYDKVSAEAKEAYDKASAEAKELDGPARMEALRKAMEIRSKALREAMEIRSKALREAMETRSKAMRDAMTARSDAMRSALKAGAEAKAPMGEGLKAAPDEAALGAMQDLGAETVPPIAELVNKPCKCTVKGTPKLGYSEGRLEALGLTGASPFALDVTCAGPGNRGVTLFASSAQSLDLFDVGDGTALTLTAKGASDSPLSGVLGSITDARKPWLPELPPSPRESPGYAEAEAEYQTALKALAAEFDKKVAVLAKAQGAAVAAVPKTHAKELADMNKEHKDSKREQSAEISEQVKEQNAEVREGMAECAEEYGEDKRDCRADVNEMKRDFAEEIREMRSELAEEQKEANAAHAEAIKEHKATLPDMLQEARVEGSKAILKVKAEQKEKMAALAMVRDGKVGGASAGYTLIADTIKALSAKRGEPVPDALTAQLGSGTGMADAYPAECQGLDMKTHVEISGDAGWCVPTDPGRVLVMGANGFEGPAEGYDDEDEFAVLGSPDKRLEEMSELSGADKSAKQKETRAKIYYTVLDGTCSGELTETSGSLTMSCDLTEEAFFTGSPPSVKRTQKCETEGGTRCSDSCSDHDDCDGWLCGCPESRCVFFRCTGCPSERICEEPEFNLTIAPYKASRAFKGADRDLAREISVDQSEHKPVVGFKVASVWRKVFMGKECDEDYDGRRVCESILEHSSGYRTKVTPVFSGFVHCPGGSCNKPTAASLAVKTGSFSVTLENNGHTAKVTCGATCKAAKGG